MNTVPNGNVAAPQPPNVLVELVKLLPQLLWFVFAVVAFAIAYGPIKDYLARGAISKLAIWEIQIEFALRQLASPQLAGAIATPRQFKPYEERIKRLADKLSGATVLWVDDNHPVQNIAERRALAALGLNIEIARDNAEALGYLQRASFDMIISDMNRPTQVGDNGAPCEGQGAVTGAGCGLLSSLYRLFGDDMPPTIVYSLSAAERPVAPAYSFGATDRVDRLLELVLDAAERRTIDAP